MNKLLAFDLEIAKAIPSGDDWGAHRPFGISVAATIASDGEEEDLRLWYGQGRPDGRPWPKMPQLQVQVLVRYLKCTAETGYAIVTWNGLGFDFSVLAEESGLHEDCVALALDHVDPMWHFFCENGYAVGLNAVAQGLGVGAKTQGMDGAKAPVLWAQGRYKEVMDYCAQDVRVTLDVVRAIQRLRRVTWLSSRGILNSWTPRARKLLTVKQAMRLPLPEPPDWIRDPWPRERFTAWLKEGGP